MATGDQLLVVIDPLARHTDGEAVRIAKDVLSAGAASTKVCLPEGPEEFARALARRGSRRPVVVGDDRALLRAVALLHRQRELTACALAMVPVGPSLGLARSLGVPIGAVAAARAALDGVERRLDLLVDDSDGVVLGALRIPAPVGATALDAEADADAETEAEAEGDGEGDRAGTGAGFGARAGVGAGGGSSGYQSWLRHWPQSLVRTLSARPPRIARVARPARIRVASPAAVGPSRLRVEVDGVTLVDLDQPVQGVSIAPGTDGGADVEVRPVSVGAEAAPLRAVGQRVTVSGADFRYRADSLVVAGPVRTRTWTVREGAWGLTLPG
ncbi:diacylglycerol kinase [Streptomyces neyagawaensis]|uniref:diacylglycerol kinase n=1 Tax=Streptomyces neyagawaensis TaxID=42238 RepID=UPI00201CF51D|nr:diacylglycerol kinase [Streptomyces neyagawaensis]MCL6736230.1 diacylglycerol kinase [Streptomyces neyagawaensis]MDE1684191.1 diacylglycerol kinase [Streptomyces neyagawaensis]